MQQQQRLAARGNDVRRIVLSSCSFCIWDNRSLPVFGRPLLLCSHIYRAKSLFFLLGWLVCFDLSSGSPTIFGRKDAKSHSGTASTHQVLCHAVGGNPFLLTLQAWSLLEAAFMLFPSAGLHAKSEFMECIWPSEGRINVWSFIFLMFLGQFHGIICYLLCIGGTFYQCLGLWDLGCAGFVDQMKQIPCALTEDTFFSC